MTPKETLGKRIRGWLPQEPNAPNASRAIDRAGSGKNLRIAAIVGGSVALAVGLLFLSILVGWALNPIVPADTRIFSTLHNNEDSLFSIDGVVAAGIARNSSTNHITGIAVYVEDDLTRIHEIPEQLGGFTVFVKRMSEASQLEKDNMVIRRQT